MLFNWFKYLSTSKLELKVIETQLFFGSSPYNRQGTISPIASLDTLCVRQDGGTSFACTIEERPLAQVVGNGGSGAGRNGGNPFLPPPG